MILLSFTFLLSFASLIAEPVPDDRAWLQQLLGEDHGALGYTAGGKVYLTELSTGETEELGNGRKLEFSPDSSKIAWIDGNAVRGRMRRGDSTVHLIAEPVDAECGVHWLGNDTVIVMAVEGRRELGWRKVKLNGEIEPVPDLDKLGKGAKETDVKLGRDGVWSYVASRTWLTGEGKDGSIGGGCSCSLSPDGRSITALQGGHRECALRAIRRGGFEGTLKWKYDGSFDNHRWSSNHERLIVCVEEKSQQMVVMDRQTSRATKLGLQHDKRAREMYGDFTVGDGRGDPWPKRTATVAFSADLDSDAPKPNVVRKPVTLGDTWPGTDEGLVFLLDDLAATNRVPVGDEHRAFAGRLRGRAIPNGRLGLDLADGWYECEDAASWILNACKASNELAVEFVFRAANLDQDGPARMLTFSEGSTQRNFTIGQKGDKLRLRLRVSKVGGGGNRPEYEFGKIDPSRFQHLVVSARPGSIEAWLDGKRVLHETRAQGDFSNWELMRLMLGDEVGGKRDWAGSVEGVAIYNRYVGEDEAKRRFELVKPRLDRKPPRQLLVDAKLIETTKTPELSRLKEYRRALTEHLYELEDGKRIIVAEWAVLDEKPLKLSHRIGETRRLRIE
ncbi:MAG: LamG-like jellyroll fold domain-containing protein, partial [Verrucomicrobiota bacterium]